MLRCLGVFEGVYTRRRAVSTMCFSVLVYRTRTLAQSNPEGEVLKRGYINRNGLISFV